MYHDKYSTLVAKLTYIGGTDPHSPHHANLNTCFDRLKQNEDLQKKLDHCIKLENENEKWEAEKVEQAAAQKKTLQEKSEEEQAKDMSSDPDNAVGKKKDNNVAAGEVAEEEAWSR